MRYVVIRGAETFDEKDNGLKDFEERVKSMTLKGWKPQGGVAMTVTQDLQGTVVLLAQAMTWQPE